jgi:CheY-like chemotaxis protein
VDGEFSLEILHIISFESVMQPGMDGYELMGHLREGVHTGEPPVVMACSADWTSEAEQRCDDVGFDGVLRKPITFSDLNQFLANLAAGRDWKESKL